MCSQGGRCDSVLTKRSSCSLTYDVLSVLCRFQTIYFMVRGWKVKSKTDRSDIIDRVSMAVNYACVCYPKQALCLQRSFVTTYLLRKHGVAAR